MSFISKETPTGTINGSNKSFTLAYSVYQIDDIWVDGAIYTDFSRSGSVLNLTDAPTVSIEVDYWTAAPAASTSSSLSDLLIKLTIKLGTSVTTNFSEAKKIDALNDARRDILLTWDLQEFITETNLSFISGVGALPSGYLRTIKELDKNGKIKDLWNNTTDEVYKRVTITRFDDEIDLTYTEKQGNLYIFDDDTVTLKFRYIYLPADMSTGSDLSGIPVALEEGFIMLAARQLLFNNRQYDTAAMMSNEANKNISNHFKKQRKDYGERRKSSFDSALLDELFII